MKRPAIDRAQIDHLATLASLSLTDTEADAMTRELEAIVAYVEELRAVDTSHVAPGHDESRAPSMAAWREDVLVAGVSHEEALGGAARITEAGFAVPGFVSPAAGAGGAHGR